MQISAKEGDDGEPLDKPSACGQTIFLNLKPTNLTDNLTN